MKKRLQNCTFPAFILIVLLLFSSSASAFDTFEKSFKTESPGKLFKLTNINNSFTSWSIPKKENRYIAGASITQYYPGLGLDPGPDEIADVAAGPKFAFEKMGIMPDYPNIGFGACLNSFLEIGGYPYSGISPYMSKFYLSTYLLAEFDLKNVITFGATGGVAGLIKRFSDYSSDDETAIRFGAGLHTSQYIQKYLSTNREGKKSFFIRLGVDQYVAVNSGYTNGGFFVFGF